MRKTGWDPPALMQDDNPQLSQWFATRPDARYVFIRNQRRKQMKVKDSTALHLRCIEADLRNYLIEPMAYSSEYFEDMHVLLLDVMQRLGVTPESEEGESE